MAFRKKAEFILAYKPDILIVQECEHPDKLIFNSGLPTPADVIWYGTNQHKGLCVFSYGNFRLKLLDVHNADLKIILPIAVFGGPVNFTLFSIWAFNPMDPNYNYIGQIWKAVQYYDGILKAENIILAGDFNSNTIWDKPLRKSNHSVVVEQLKALNIFSTYHTHFNMAQGIEKHPTFFLYRHKNKPYHIDYCFASANLIAKLDTVEVGMHEDWAKHSDHNPLIVSFKI
jgi:exonuclease III